MGNGLILVTGASGYVGGRLVHALIQDGRRVRCVSRHPEWLAREGVESVYGDALAPDTLSTALTGVHTAYYLIHSLQTGGSFEDTDRQAARNFATAAISAKLQRIVYLGGLGDSGAELSSHLRSRQEVGQLLRDSGIPVVEFRSSIIIGSGSLSFDIMRALVERLPIMIAPRWVSTPTQPIAIEDVIRYLVKALNVPVGEGHIFEIGGADVLAYGEIMREYARQRGLRRWIVEVPFLTPRLSSLWLALITPAHSRVGRRMVEGLRNPTTVHNDSAHQAFDFKPMGMREAIQRALLSEEKQVAETHWANSLSSGRVGAAHESIRFGSRIVDTRSVDVDCPPAEAFRPIRRIGGTQGWYFATSLWRLRGLLDLLMGGVGLRRGRRNQETVGLGDMLDFWRVEQFEPDRRLRLSAEMKVPGRAWLEFEVVGNGHGSTIHQTAIFDPIGLSGLLYWYALYPIHYFIFKGMLERIAKLSCAANTAARG